MNTGDYKELSGLIVPLLDNQAARNLMGENARKRVLAGFTVEKQLGRLVLLMRQVANS